MFRPRRTPITRGTASESTTDPLVREAEAIVHRTWQIQLSERRHEMEAALRRATARCDTAQRSLTAARQSGDPRRIATSLRDLEKAQEAARKTSLAWEQVRQVLTVEAGLAGTGAPPSAVTAVVSWTDPDDYAVAACSDQRSDPGRLACWAQRFATLFSRHTRASRTRRPIDLPANQG